MMYWLWLVMFTELALGSGSNCTLLWHSDQTKVLSGKYGLCCQNAPFTMERLHIPILPTERIQLPSRRLLAETTGTVATVTTLSYPTLDKSFKTNPYWLKLDLTIPEATDIETTEFTVTMETNLARAYSEGKTRRDQRAASVQTLLERLNPDNDPLLNWRRRRAVTVNGDTAQIIDLSRDITYPTNAALVFYMAKGDTNIPAGVAKAVFNELTLQEMTMYLQVVVKSAPVEFVRPAITTSPPTSTPSSLLALWIVLGILGGFMLLFLCCCCTFCICCRRPMKPATDGPMDADAYKELQHKQKVAKYPYRPYKASSQTSHGIEEANGTVDSGIANVQGSKFKLQSSGTGSVLKSKLDVLSAKRAGNDPYSYSDLSESGSSADSSPSRVVKKWAGDKETISTVASSAELNSSGRSRHSRMHKLRSLPPTGQTGESDELRRIYLEAQREISRVLEPDIIPDQSNQTYAAPDRRLESGGKSKKGRRKGRERETEFQEKLTNNSVPEASHARKSSRNQGIASRKPETLQEAKRKVHSLIDEAFSLVGLPRNVVCPAPRVHVADDVTPTLTDEELINNQTSDELFQKKISGSAPNLSAEVKERKGSVTVTENKNISLKKDLTEQGTQVVVVPVTHQPDRTGRDVIWNPYSVGDQLAKLQKSQEFSVVAEASLGHKPHQPAKHLTLPHPASLTETKKELSSQHKQGRKSRVRNQRRLSVDDTLMESERSISTGLGRRSTDLERQSKSLTRRLSTRSLLRLQNTTADDPYLDPYLKKTVNEELDATYMLSPLSDSLSSTEDDPYAIALSRSRKDPRSRKLDLASTQADAGTTDLMPRKRQVGKAVEDGYDELDVTRNVSKQDKPGEVVAAIRDELIRLAKKSGPQGSS